MQHLASLAPGDIVFSGRVIFDVGRLHSSLCDDGLTGEVIAIDISDMGPWTVIAVVNQPPRSWSGMNTFVFVMTSGGKVGWVSKWAIRPPPSEARDAIF